MQRGIADVEIFVPSPLLETGMWFVDTPELGSVLPETRRRPNTGGCPVTTTMLLEQINARLAARIFRKSS
jgi:hypothetical protein